MNSKNFNHLKRVIENVIRTQIKEADNFVKIKCCEVCSCQAIWNGNGYDGCCLSDCRVCNDQRRPRQESTTGMINEEVPQWVHDCCHGTGKFKYKNMSCCELIDR